MSDTNFDVVIIGGGPGGYVAAIRASQLKMKVALVEANHLGGICLNWGCIPTKALLRSAEINHFVNHAADYGIKIEGKISVDLAKVVARSRDVAKKLSGGIAHLMKKNKVTVFDGFGKLAGKGKVSLEKDGKKIADLSAKHIILATGARTRVLPGLEPDGKLVWSYKEDMVPTGMPKSLLIVGSGAIGIEFASFYRSLGADVTVVEMMDRILPVEDDEISTLARKQFEKQGIKILTGSTVKGLKKSANDVTASIESAGKKQDIKVDRVISAVGIVGNVENIGIENTKIKVDRGHIVVNEWLQTGEPGVYAIGDVVGAPWLAHKASHEAVICVEKIAGQNDVHPLNRDAVPGCTYSHPQVASIGWTEKKAKESGREIRVGRFPFMGNGKAIALGEPEGLVKTIFDAKSGELLGAHMIGAEVTEMIQGFGIAKAGELTEAELMHTIFPHPTLSEMMHESTLDAFGKVIHF
ncbi:MAG: dihydrolipoyl dehydrogenase [Alphaproteobacteria bacterium]|nr:MAG: dihydrolipoyl dehydrogenase [Alphaproteobacteria bacterium]